MALRFRSSCISTPLTTYIYLQTKTEHRKHYRNLKELSQQSYYYPLAGRLCYTKGGRLELDLNAKGVIFIESETTKTIHDYGDFTPSDSTNELIPKVDYNRPIEEIPLLMVQLTRFQNKEDGFVLVISPSHVTSDGVGHFNFINSWAKVARGETLEANELPFLDRTILKFTNPPFKPRFEHVELKPLPLILDTKFERENKIAAESFKLTAEEVEKLKKKANEFNIPKESRPYTRFEAIGAHIWKCVSKARELSEKQPSVVRYNVEIRKRIIPNLPKNYYGNALIQTSARGYIGEITSKPLSYVAQKLREATELITNEYINSQIDVIRGFETLDDARALFIGGGQSKNAKFFGNPNLHLTVWINLPAYEVDFGWGKPLYFGYGNLTLHDRGIILSSPDGDGSIIVSMHFQVALMQLFKKFFYGDLYELFTSARL